MTNETISGGAPVVDREPRCWRCRKKLANFLARPWDIDCVRCKAKNAGAAVGGDDAPCARMN